MRTSNTNKSFFYNNENENEQKELEIHKKELDTLKKIHNQSDMINLIGPKNSGKTFLVNEFFKNNESAYFIDAKEIKSIDHLKLIFKNTQKILLFEEATVIEGVVINSTFNSIILKTDEMESIFKIEKADQYEENDVLQIINGQINKIGKIKKNEILDLNCKILNIPKGNLIQKKIISKEIKIIDLIKNNFEKNIENKIIEWIDKNKAKIIESTLIIDNSDLLDLKIQKFLSNKKNIFFSPKIILISRFELKIKNLEILKLFDLEKEDLKKIFKKRFFFENLNFNDEILNRFLEIAKNYSLKFALNLLSIFSAHLHAEGKNCNVEELENILEVYKS